MSSPLKSKSSRSKKSTLRLGLFGGTFDPVHLGHVIQAQDALEQARLDAILFIPCRQSPHKKNAPQASEIQRLAMLRLAVKSFPQFWVSRCELDRPALEPSYALTTVREIQAAFPQAKLFWLIGEDQLPRLDTWHKAAVLQKEVKFLLLPRGKEELPPLPAHVLSLPRPRRLDLSATEIRQRVRKKLSVDHLVSPPVALYLRRHQPY